jgi:hypothetical protein
MDVRQKIINAIQNRRERLRQLELAQAALATAKENVVNADLELARQLKNFKGIGSSVAFEGEIFSVHGGGDQQMKLHVAPCEFEILEKPK